MPRKFHSPGIYLSSWDRQITLAQRQRTQAGLASNYRYHVLLLEKKATGFASVQEQLFLLRKFQVLANTVTFIQTVLGHGDSSPICLCYIAYM